MFFQNKLSTFYLPLHKKILFIIIYVRQCEALAIVFKLEILNILIYKYINIIYINIKR